jgi:hypothetical protein
MSIYKSEIISHHFHLHHPYQHHQFLYHTDRLSPQPNTTPALLPQSCRLPLNGLLSTTLLERHPQVTQSIDVRQSEYPHK